MRQAMAGQDDAFIEGLKDRLPADLRETFSAEQLAALKVAFGARQWGRHPVDVRGTLKLWRWRYYFVVLAGRNRRELSRLEEDLSRLMKATLILGFLTFSTLIGLLVLYLAKSALGIDLFPDFSLGIWGWFKGEFL